ncbi:hypothetical protein ACFL51_00575 [Myxococcota bacterium]
MPFDGVYQKGASNFFSWSTSPESSVTGDILISRLEAIQEGLSIRVSSDLSGSLGGSETVGAQTQEAAFRCPFDQQCYVHIQRSPNATDVDLVEYSLDIFEVSPFIESLISTQGLVRDFELRSNLLYSVGPAGLTIADRNTLDILSQLTIPASTGITFCGSFLCVSRMSGGGFSVLDTSSSTTYVAFAGDNSIKSASDITYSNNRIYLAQGTGGVGIYELDNSGTASYFGTVSLDGKAVSVAANKQVLAIASSDGYIYIYDIFENPPAQNVVFEAQGKIKKIGFKSGQLWILGKQSNWVEIYKQSSNTTFEFLGATSEDPGVHFNSKFLGSKMYSIVNGNLLRFSFELP